MYQALSSQLHLRQIHQEIDHQGIRLLLVQNTLQLVKHKRVILWLGLAS